MSPSSTWVAGRSTDRRLHDCGDVAGVQSVSRGRITVRLDDDIGLPERLIHENVGHAGDLFQGLLKPGSYRLISIEIIAEYLDRVLARFYARKRFVDVVLDIL